VHVRMYDTIGQEIQLKCMWDTDIGILFMYFAIHSMSIFSLHTI